MKNLKKVLSLVLALAMALSLMTVAFAKDAKDFADGDKITNTEAVSVLTALNVINGKSNNLFDPAGTVTRAEMAKMITVIALGDVDVSAFKGTKTNLKDATGWAEAYVKYCYSQGIISGRGNGIFDPNAKVTASEAAKMLLVAIGYNAKVQGYEGANWAINVTRDAQTSGFFKDLSVASTKALTRDEAAQMIYNAVDAKIIEKHSSVDRVTGDITDIYHPSTSKTLLTETFEAKTWIGTYVGNYDNSVATNKGEIVVNGKLNTADSTDPKVNASFPSDMNISNTGEEVKVIFKDGKGGVTGKPDKKDTIYGVYNTGNTKVITAVMNDIKNQKSSDAKINIGGTKYDTKDSVNVFYNYVNSAASKNAKNGNDTTNSALTNELKKQTNDALKFVCDDNDGKIQAVYVTEYAITNVTAVTSTKVTLKGVGTLTIADNDIYSGIAKDDVVVYNKFYSTDKDDALFVVTKAETIEGKLEGYKKDSSDFVNVVVNGTTYAIDSAPTALPVVSDDSYTTLADSNIGDSVKLYMLNGMVGAIEKVKGESNYAVITDSVTTGTLGSDLNPWKVVLMLSDGTKVTKSLPTTLKPASS